MKTGTVLTSVVLLAAGGLAVAAGNSGIDELNMGLSKTSVFDTPTPEPFSYSDTKAGKSKVLPRAYPGIPPQIPHKIDTYLPITAEDNQCLDCHDKPNLIDKKNTGKSPMSRAHYVDLRGSDDEMKGDVVGARFNCTQCHIPQSGAPALVDNTFEGDN
jgi:nitrate reductase (cytochrome), electron transfer subunit